MAKTLKKILRIITILLTMIALLAVPVYAGEYNGGGEDGLDPNKDHGVYEGISSARSGYLIWLSDGSGKSINGVVACATADGKEPYTKTGAPLAKVLITRFGESVTLYSDLPVPWSVPPFTGANRSNEGAVKAFLTSPQPQLDSESGADYVCISYLGITKEQLDAYKTQYGELYLNVSPWCVGGVYGSSSSSYMGFAIAGTDVAWARYVDSNNYLSRYTHGTLSNSFHYVESWLGLAVPSNVTSKHSSSEILSSTGWGIISVRVKEGDKQIVKVYRTDGVVDNTSYSSTSSPVSIKDEGGYKVKKWHTSKIKTKAKGKQDYPPFVSECPPVQSGSGVATVTMPPEEKAIFVLLEREKVDASPVLTPDAIRAHELNYIFRYMDSKRDETAGAGRAFEGVNFIFNNVKSQYERPTSDTVRNWETDEDYEVVEECSGATAESGRAVHYYNEAVGCYLPWNETKDPFGLDEEIDTHYSVNVSRVYWESNLHSVEYRDSGMNGYADEVLGISPSLVGEITEADPGSNVESTLPDAQVNNYSFTAKLQEYWEERDILGYEKEIDEETGEEIEGDPIYSEWRDMDDWILHKIVDYSITTYCDKYKVMVTPQASVSSAGTVLEEFSGNTLLGHSALPVQIVSTQLSGTLTFYPEVPMTVWYTPDLVNYAEPTNELIYILGEYPRKCTPPAMHGYSTRIEGGRMEGTTTLPAPATGTVAQETYDYYAERGNFINGVTAMGTTFETATKNRHQMTIVKLFCIFRTLLLQMSHWLLWIIMVS